MSKIDFTDRVVIVTGAGGGLGRSHAQLIAERGGKVVVNDIKGAAQAVEEITAAGLEAIVSEHDISRPHGAADLVAATIDAYGKVDALINNAMAMKFTSPAEATPEEYELVRGAGLDGAFYLTCGVWPHMVERGYGRILMTTSGTGLISNVEAVTYAIAKAGCFGLMRATSHDGAEHGIKVNALAPAAFTPGAASRVTAESAAAMQRQFPVELVSPVAALLCSEECPVTGRVIEASGGRVGSVFIGVTTGGYYGREMTPEAVLDSWPLPIDQSDWQYYEEDTVAMGDSLDKAMRKAGVEAVGFVPDVDTD